MPFKPGESGNIAGRPKGSKDRRTIFREMIEPQKGVLIKKAIDLALSGNESMLKLLLDRLLPTRPKDDLVEIDSLEGSLTAKGNKIIDLIVARELSPLEAKTLLDTLTAQAKLIETDELVKRIEKLEGFNHE